MSKRKLTRRQSWRVQKVQDEKASRLARKQGQLDATDLSIAEEQGLVISHLGKQVTVEPQQGDGNLPCHFRANLGAIVTGDQVVFRRDNLGQGVVETILPRTNLLARPDVRGNLKPVAANIDFMVLVITPDPPPSSVLIDRYIVAAELQDIPIKILLNKTDLLNEGNQQHTDELMIRYAQIGYPTWRCSAHNTDGLADLKAELNQHTSVFVGQSGVGKSSLVNALLPNEQARVGEISQQSKLGRHTTTNAKLFHFPSGGRLIDSPGIREFGLWHLPPEQVIEGFRDFSPWRFECKFRDCKHRQEPGCALQEAVTRGEVHPQRLASYFAILASLTET